MPIKKVTITGTITGLYGCYCHSFESWEDEKKHRLQKLNRGDVVTHRCTGKKGTVEGKSGGNYYSVKFGTRGVASDLEMEHAANLIKQ